MYNQPVTPSSSSIAKTMSIVLAIICIILVSNVQIVNGASQAKNPHKNHIIDAPFITQKIHTNRTIIVDINGNGYFKSIQAAINSIPHGNSNWIIVHVRKGFYREKVSIPRSKPFIFMRGNGLGKTHIVNIQSSIDNVESATFKVQAPNFVAFGISFKNNAPTGLAFTSQNQSVAAFVPGDKVAFYHCGFFSSHNTLFDAKGRHYYHDCYIQGSIDLIFGRARTLFHDCEIFVLVDQRIKIKGSITGHKRKNQSEKSRYIFHKGRVYGTDEVYLGRARGAYSTVIFAKTYLSRTIAPRGWTNWSYDGSTENLYHAEHDCHGPGSSTGDRASWSRRLTEEEAAPFICIDYIDRKEWLPAWLE